MEHKIRILNPFITTGYVSSDYFCDREKETADILQLLQNGNHIAIISPRRYGKTDLIRHCFSQKEISENYYTFIIDIYSTKSFSDMVNQLGKTILNTLRSRGEKAWNSFLSFLLSIRGGITYDACGNPTWSLSVGDIDSPHTTLDEIFRYLQNADKPCLVAIDEFQQVTKYNDDSIEAALRTHIQCTSNAHFLFCGSQQHLMGTIFTSSGRPFYQSVTLYSLQRISLDKYKAFCLHHFHTAGKELQDGVVETVYEQFDGVTYYLQRIMNELYSITPAQNTCLCSDVETAVRTIIANASTIYEDLLYQLPAKQLSILNAIAKDGKVKNITSGAFAKKHSLLSPSSVKSAIPALLDKGLITYELGYYKLHDKFLEIWIRERF